MPEWSYGQNTRVMWRLADPKEYVLADIMNVLSCAIDSIGHACWPWCRASLIKNYYCEMNIWQPRTASSEPSCRAGSGCRMRSGPPWPRSPNDSDASPEGYRARGQAGYPSRLVSPTGRAEVRRLPESCLSRPASSLAGGGDAGGPLGARKPGLGI